MIIFCDDCFNISWFEINWYENFLADLRTKLIIENDSRDLRTKLIIYDIIDYQKLLKYIKLFLESHSNVNLLHSSKWIR